MQSGCIDRGENPFACRASVWWWKLWRPGVLEEPVEPGHTQLGVRESHQIIAVAESWRSAFVGASRQQITQLSALDDAIGCNRNHHHLAAPQLEPDLKTCPTGEGDRAVRAG